MKSLPEMATPEQLEIVRAFARKCEVTVYYDRPYNHFKGWGIL